MADVSLDDLIQRRKIRFGRQQGTKVNDGGGKGWVPMKGRLNKPGYSDRTTPSGGFGDVRNKIIHKKRLRMRDARDRLAELAKQGDARDRINKMRKKTVPLKSPPVWNPEKIMHNENQPSHLTGKTRMRGTALIRTVAGEVNSTKPPGPPIRRQLTSGLQSTQRRNITSGRYHPIPSNPHVVTIKNEKAEMQSPYNQSFNSFRAQVRAQPVKHATRVPMSRAATVPSYASLSRERSGMRSAGMMQARPPVSLMHRPRKSPDMEEVHPTRLEITTSNNYKEPSPTYSDDWDYPARHPPRPPIARPVPARLPDTGPERLAVRVPAKKRPIYEEKQIEPMRHPKKIAAISSGLMARLDQPQRTSQMQGTRVLVTNLHHCVSVEDMEELFGTIGTIISARMVREGVAEAIFLNEEDAHKSVEVFNNRQLDGQPMCVSVCKKVPVLPAPLQPPKTETKSVLKAASGGSSSVVKPTTTNPVMKRHAPVTPNISAIHQALFNRSQPPTSGQVFLVKLPKPQAKKDII
ncbi:uncharacterized protein LOC126998750 isoform X1 [Eriocheir sinensis]|uniref:uncharacterized protein LOC126998750 isoform X1 n=1 Tax=Eriocheir sinensis TaxID=95602 RepID=UPI0021C845BA|nr:uncharacterized protein LOC126998750 isoform X1 [Eriocheir sinensis]